MGVRIKNFIASVTGKKNKDNIVKIGRYSSDAPEVRINDVELTVTLGQWMGLVPDAIKSGGNGMFVISSLEASELIKRNGLSKIDFSNIIRRFSHILSMIGINSGNTCILDNFDEKTLSFRCNFFESGEIATMKIRFGSWLDECPALIVEFDGIVSRYDYLHADKKNEDRIYLSNFSKNLDKNGNKKFYHYVSEYRYIGYVYDNYNKVELEIKYPDSLEYDCQENIYVNEELLEEILSSVSFPVDVESLVSRIAEALKKDVKEYPIISVIVKKLAHEKNKNDNVTDEAIFKNGEFDKLTLTKNDKKITVDQFDTWSYSTKIANVSQSSTPEQGKILNYGYNSIPIDECDSLDSPQALINEAKGFAEEVKTLGKTMLTKRTTK